MKRAAAAKGGDAPLLTARQLNRATLARQQLLARESATALAAVERLVAMQAQLARPPFVGLWTRLTGFRREELTRLYQRKKVVRVSFLRGTLHLVSVRDYQRLRAAVQPAADRGMQSILRERLKTFDREATLAEARAFFAEAPRTFDELRDYYAERKNPGDVRARSYVARCQLPLVQVPTDDSWSFPAAARFALAEDWLGAPLPAADDDPAPLVLRYLAAFGPASVTDVQSWSGLASLRATLDGLRDQLSVFRDPRGRELFDLPKAPRPDGDVDAPVRFLPEYDSLMLGHDDRSRFIADEHRPALITKNLQIPGAFLVDGVVAGTWKLERAKKTATLVVASFAALSKATRTALEAEGESLVRFVESDAESFAVRFARR